MKRRTQTEETSGDDEVPRSEGTAERRIYTDSPAVLQALFSNDLVRNLKHASERLGVRMVSRDNWVKAVGADEKKVQAAENFVQTLLQFYRMTGTPPLQHDFERITEACAGNGSAGLGEYFAARIKVSPKKREIMPRTPVQLEYVRAIREKTIVFGVGPAGTGKTYLAMAAAVSHLLSGECDRIVLTRPAVEAGENLGFLPGKLEDKINPYLRPLYDALYDMMDMGEAETLIERNVIEVAPLAFMRGRTLNRAFVILDEAQNATPEQMLMFLTRLGMQSKCIVCGDPTQTDLPSRRASGLCDALRRLSRIPEIAVCRFTSSDVVRHRLVEQIVQAYSETAEPPPEPETKEE